MDNIIKIDNLSKSFGDVHAVRDLSLEVRRGELFAFLGVNGAGKSTTISIICGALSADSGKITVCGEDISKSMQAVRPHLGVVFQSSVLDRPLSVRDNLRSRAALYGISGKSFNERLDELCELLDFGDLLGRTVGKLSGGQRRRIDIARALIHRPDILILDEPLSGVDVEGMSLLMDMLDEIRKNFDLSILMTTHDFTMLEQYCDQVVLLQGKILRRGTPLDVLSSDEFAKAFHMGGGAQA